MYIIVSGFRFAWDRAKATANLRKHGVSFSEASTTFGDEDGLLLDDLAATGDDERYVLLGVSSALRLLVVVHTYRDDARTIRLISARKATRSERAQYQARFRP